MCKECVGFHGTSANNIQSIQKNGFRYSDDSQWFGRGVYLFETSTPLTDGKDEAKRWAIFVKKFTKWVVFQLNIKSNRFIDLVEVIEHKKLYDKVRETLYKKHIQSGRTPNKFDDRTVIKLLAEEQIDFIRVPVDGCKQDSYNRYVIRIPQIQICVKNIECIENFVIVDRGD